MIPLALLGRHLFTVDTATLSRLTRTWQFNVASLPQVGREPIKQYIGPGEQTIELPGVIYPGQYGLANFVESVSIEAAKGHPLRLITFHRGIGRNWGCWYVQQCREDASMFDSWNSARKIEFSMSLSFHGMTYEGPDEKFSLGELLKTYTQGSNLGNLF